MSLEQCEEIFKHFDTDGDGIISGEEFGRIFKLLDPAYTDKHIQLMFQNADCIERDGVIDIDEFFHWLRQDSFGSDVLARGSGTLATQKNSEALWRINPIKGNTLFVKDDAFDRGKRTGEEIAYGSFQYVIEERTDSQTGKVWLRLNSQLNEYAWIPANHRKYGIMAQRLGGIFRIETRHALVSDDTTQALQYRLGCECEPAGSDALILTIFDDGFISRWNQAFPMHSVQVGDFFVGMSGAPAGAGLYDELTYDGVAVPEEIELFRPWPCGDNVKQAIMAGGDSDELFRQDPMD